MNESARYAREKRKENPDTTLHITHHWVNPALNPRLASSLSSRYLSPSRCDREPSSKIEATLSDHSDGLSLCRIFQTVSSIGPRGGSTSRRRWSRLKRRTVVDLLDLLQPWYYSFLNTNSRSRSSKSSKKYSGRSIPFLLRKNEEYKKSQTHEKPKKKERKENTKNARLRRNSLDLSFLWFVPSKQRQSDFLRSVTTTTTTTRA